MGINVRKMNEIADDTVAIENSLNSISTSVETVYSQLIQIADATEEQTETSNNTSANIQTISNATRETTAETVNSLKISQDIQDIAESMYARIRTFKL